MQNISWAIKQLVFENSIVLNSIAKSKKDTEWTKVIFSLSQFKLQLPVISHDQRKKIWNSLIIVPTANIQMEKAVVKHGFAPQILCSPHN